MPDQPPGASPQNPGHPAVNVNFRVTDTDPLLAFISSIVKVYEAMAGGELTLEEATEALGRVLSLFEGEAL